jgi:hypothetical protein
MPTTPDCDKAKMMNRFGITKIPAHRYHYREWQYCNLDDALAQAKRDVAHMPQ